MRGASALDAMLRSLPGEPLRALVVWEPVLPTDLGPPTSGVLARAGDPRAAQFWDPERRLSDRLAAASRADPHRFGVDPPGLPEDAVVWDVIAVFPAEAAWGGPDALVPAPASMGFPVVDAIDEAREAVLRELAKPGVRSSGRGTSGPPASPPR